MRVGDTVYVVVRMNINVQPVYEVYVDERRVISADGGNTLCLLWESPGTPQVQFHERHEVFVSLAYAYQFRNQEAVRLRREGNKVTVFDGVGRNGQKAITEEVLEDG